MKRTSLSSANNFLKRFFMVLVLASVTTVAISYCRLPIKTKGLPAPKQTSAFELNKSGVPFASLGL